MADHQPPRLRDIHQALADPLRLQLLELVSAQPSSARELAVLTGRQPNRLYHHLAQLEDGGLIEVVEYRRVRGGKVERVYAPTTAEPPGDAASPADRARFLSAVLELTRADITAACQAEEDGERRDIDLMRSVIRISAERLAELRTHIDQFVHEAQDHPDDDGVWTTVLWTAIDRQDRRPAASSPAQPRKTRPQRREAKELSSDPEPELWSRRGRRRLPEGTRDHLPHQDHPTSPGTSAPARRGHRHRHRCPSVMPRRRQQPAQALHPTDRLADLPDKERTVGIRMWPAAGGVVVDAVRPAPGRVPPG